MRRHFTAKPYPKPGEAGGRLVRAVIAHLRNQGVGLPIKASHILIACSGGADSVALARLVTRYGRKLTGEAEVSLLHVNHGWRGEDSERDAEFVRQLAKDWGVQAIIRNVRTGSQKLEGESWEDLARRERRRIFIREAKRASGVVLTAHHSEDLAETVFWRLLTGAIRTHGAGIETRFEEQIRPLLSVRKRALTRFLAEEGIAWRHDSTNEDTRFMRARLRHEVFPVLEGVFPRAVEHLAEMGLTAQRVEQMKPALTAAALLPPVRVKRAHWEALESLEFRREAQAPPKQLHLPQGWRILRESAERWVLERQEVRSRHRASGLTTRAKQSEPKRKIKSPLVP
jgi:tRNA(Ile)-lysidine synthetase-like protein